MNVEDNKWIQFEEKSDLKLRIFCLPYAGGGASIYRQWQTSMPEDIQICKIQLPGRENRINEYAIDCMEELVKTLAKQISPYMDKPFAIFGHSMGAMASFELAKYLSQNTQYKPEHVFISACRTPNMPHDKMTYHLQGEEFLDSLRQRGGTNEILLKNKEYMQMIEPYLRADLKLIEKWHHQNMDTIDCPITALAGKNDSLVAVDSLKQWEKYTKNTFELKIFEGDHFFINDTHNNIPSSIINKLK